MGDEEKELSEEDEEKLCNIKQEASAAFGDGDFEKAAAHFTEAIKMNASSALMFAKRANWYFLNCKCVFSLLHYSFTASYIHMKKPNACIRDCDRALQINPDSAAARKYRGRALR